MGSGHRLIVFFILPLCCFASARKVQLTLYYETLCPYCSTFIVNRLPNIFYNSLVSIVDLRLVPYGNARVGPDTSISCQHGPYECLLNTLEACAISRWTNVMVHFNFIYCVEHLAMENRYMEWESCFTAGMDLQTVIDCYNSGYGKKLELQYAAQTDALQPPHKYVPWVVVDGQPLYDDYENFEAYICRAYDGELPEACKGKRLSNTRDESVDSADRVCHVKKMIKSSPYWKG